MVYLPSELWLHILSYTDSSQDLWRSVRRINRQLRDCVEQHFADTIIPTIKLELSFGLPCYDGRNPLRGKGIFQFSHIQKCPESGVPQRVVSTLVDVEPEHYMEQLLVRWERLRESSCGCLPESLEWRMSIIGGSDGDGSDEGRSGVRREETVRLKDPVAYSNNEKAVEGSAVGFEWKATMTSLFS